MSPASESGSALLSVDRVYRYWLLRDWSSAEKRVGWIGLNPSTADESRLDPTLRRIARFSEDWGYTGFIMLNLFAYRATDPIAMKAVKDPVGPDNDKHILEVAAEVDFIVCCWGAHGAHRERAQTVLDMLRIHGNAPKLHYLKLTQKGQPMHPLYISSAELPKVLT